MKLSKLSRWISILFVLVITLPQSGCYSFNPGSIGTAKTITIKNFINLAGTTGPASLSQDFTEKLRTYFQQNTSLSLVNKNADWLLEGQIIKFTTIPIAPQQNQKTSQTRLSISVKAKFTDNLKERKDFEKVFEYGQNFDSNESLITAEQQGIIETILNQLVFDVYSSTTSSW